MPRKPPAKRLFSGMVGLPPSEPEIVVAEPAQTPPVTVIPPHDADARPVPRSAITPEVRTIIKESLASKPNVIADPRTTVTTKKTADALLATKKENKQPAYLKSVAHTAVPSADPEAPYGRDENNRPILPGHSDQELATDLLSKPFLKAGSCPHKSNPKYCLLCGTANFKTAPPEPVDLEDQLRSLLGITTDNIAVPSAPAEPTDPEEQLRRQFGLSTISSGATTVKKKLDYFPEILGITRGQLIGLLELAVGIEPRAIRKKVLKSKLAIDSQIAELERAAARIIELKKYIKDSQDIIDGLQMRIMKLRRNPEDIPDKATREAFKREENQKIEKYEQEKHELQKLLRDSDIEQLKQRAANWGSSPDDFEMVSASEDVVVKFRDKFVFREANKEEYAPTHTIDGYIAFLDQYDLLKDVSRRLRQFPVLDEWRYFENEIVLQAIGFGVYRPTKQAFTEYPQLRKYMDGAPVEDPEQDDHENVDDREDALILKTGGAQIGGSIHSGGHRNGRQRPLESFDKRKSGAGPGASTEYGGEQPDNFQSSSMDSGDLDERRGDE